LLASLRGTGLLRLTALALLVALLHAAQPQAGLWGLGMLTLGAATALALLILREAIDPCQPNGPRLIPLLPLALMVMLPAIHTWRDVQRTTTPLAPLLHPVDPPLLLQARLEPG